MADSQDNVLQALERVDDLFKRIENAGLSFEILKPGKTKDQAGKELAQVLAMSEVIADTFEFPNIRRIMAPIRELNQIIDGYKVDKSIEAEKAGHDPFTEEKKK